jgi:drug/metabolite transporter (DMT)-like permease
VVKHEYARLVDVAGTYRIVLWIVWGGAAEIAGVALFLGSSVFYVLGLKRGEVSVLYPMVSLANVWTMIWSRVFFKEPITHAKTLGLALILIGVFFIGFGAGR